MRYKILLLLICLLVITGCVSKKEQINQLVEDAEVHIENGKFEEAILIYEEILELEDTQEYQDKLEELQHDKEALEEELEKVEEVRLFQEELYDIQKNRTRSGISVSMTDMEYIVKDIRKLIDDFEDLDDSGSTAIENLIRTIKSDFKYYMMKQWIDSDIFEDAGLSEGLSNFDTGFKTKITLLTATVRNDINDGIDMILSHEIPSKYE